MGLGCVESFRTFPPFAPSQVDMRGCPPGQDDKCKKSRVGGAICEGKTVCPAGLKSPFAYNQGSLWLTKHDHIAQMPDTTPGMSCEGVCQSRYGTCKKFLESAKYESCLMMETSTLYVGSHPVL